MLNTRAGELLNANDVINSNDLRKRILNIDSRFRTDIKDSTTDFSFKFTHAYKNLIRLRIASIEIPNVFYTFTTLNNSFTVTAYDISCVLREVCITIESGNYTAADLITTLQELLDETLRDPYGIYITITIDAHTAKITFTQDGLSAYPVTCKDPAPTQPGRPFFLDFATIEKFKKRPTGFGLGYNLGFRKPVYKVSKEVCTCLPFPGQSITSEACLDVVGETYMFLSINDLHTVEQTTYGTYLQCLAKIIIREDKFSIIYDDGSTLMANEIIFPSPTDLKYLQVQLLDPYGDVVDLNGMNFSFSIEITEVLNTSLYDFYRNYIWMGGIPSLKRQPNGSAMTVLNGPR